MKLLVWFFVVLLATCSGQKNRVGDSSDDSESTDSVANTGARSKEDLISNENAKSAESPSYTNPLSSVVDSKDESSTKHNKIDRMQDSDNDLTLVVSDSYSGMETPETLIIKDAKSLTKFYSLINRTRKPGLPVPNIDFSKEMIIVRCGGTIREGTTPELYVKDRTEEQITLGIHTSSSVAGSTAVTTPFSLYKMPLSKAEVVVEE